jgi:hypothetical protein
MSIIIIAFPAGKQKTASRIRELLNRYGYGDVMLITTGSEVLQETGRRDGGIVISPIGVDRYALHGAPGLSAGKL